LVGLLRPLVQIWHLFILFYLLTTANLPHYIHSTHDHGIHYTSALAIDPVHTFVHFPDSSNVEAYTDAKPPSPSHSSPLTSYSDACWGSQIGSAIRERTLLPLFKCRSMSGGIIF
jgi:hypothetical protein